MTVTADGPDVVAVVRALSDANVQFVVVGEAGSGHPLQVVVSRHPTNLEALGRALERLESTVRASALAAPSEEASDDPPPRRVGDPMATIPVATSGGDLDLMFGGPRRSLYAEVAMHAEERDIGGVRVQWAGELPAVETVSRMTSRMLSRRLLSLAEGLAHLIERQDEERSQSDGELDPES